MHTIVQYHILAHSHTYVDTNRWDREQWTAQKIGMGCVCNLAIVVKQAAVVGDDGKVFVREVNWWLEILKKRLLLLKVRSRAAGSSTLVASKQRTNRQHQLAQAAGELAAVEALGVISVQHLGQ